MFKVQVVWLVFNDFQAKQLDLREFSKSLFLYRLIYIYFLLLKFVIFFYCLLLFKSQSSIFAV